MTAALELYERALEDPTVPLIVSGSSARVARWLGPVTAADERALARIQGPVLDVGCGPGRHLRALARRGVLAIGVDISSAAVSIARRRGTPVLQTSVFDHVPGAGRWRSALLLDGNIGIGGSPEPLLTRIASLLAPRGQLLVELEPPGVGVEAREIDLERGGLRSRPFAWAFVGVDAIDRLATSVGFHLVDTWSEDNRHFGLLCLR